MILPTLYKKSSSGNIQAWRIEVYGPHIVTSWWTEAGDAPPQKTVEEAKAKNVGKKNETTPETQAEKEAAARWSKQLKKGYIDDFAKAQAGEVSEVIEGKISPMLAHRYDQHGHKIAYPAYVQPKLDGHRCIAQVDRATGKVTLWTRTRKPITSMPHIVRGLEDIASNFAGLTMFDGELYIHGETFEETTSLIRAKEPKPGHQRVQYHVYDVAQGQRSFAGRAIVLDSIHMVLSTDTFSDVPVHVVTTSFMANEEAAMQLYQRYMDEGYEGAMVRNAHGLYENKRSYHLQKIKFMHDAEFRIVAVEEGKGQMAGRAVFVCETPEGERFSCKMKGSLDSLEQYVKDPSLALDKMLTVQYQELTERGIPRFPVGIRLKEVL